MQDIKQKLYAGERKVFFSDGFKDGIWEEKDENNIRRNQNIYYLHGALFLLPLNPYTTQKLSSSKHPSKENLFQQIEKHIQSGYFPLFVTEGSAEQKISEIRKNSYLNHSYHALSQIHGSLFIFGSSISEFDRHIWKKLSDNTKIEKFFIGLHKSSAKETERNVKKVFSSRLAHIEFFNTDSANLWQEISEFELAV